jgi:hypothetical protein
MAPAAGESRVMVSCAAVTATVVKPQIEPAQALTVGDPVATAKAWPKLVESFVKVVNVLSEELHVADDSTWVLLSLKVPVATKSWVMPTEFVGAAGVTTIETSPGGVKDAGS